MRTLVRISKKRSVARGGVLAGMGLMLSVLSACLPSGSVTGAGIDGLDPGLWSAPPLNREYTTDVLLFSGTGTWSAEVSELRGILAAHGASYREVSSAQLDSMTLDELGSYGTLLFPGGYGGTQASSLSSATHARLRQAVQERGVSYLGFCAGSFIAVAPRPAAGKDVSYGLGVAEGPILDYYYLENQGVSAAMTLETFADGSQRDLVWYGGPVTPEISGGVIARYPNGQPAITQMRSGAGFVLLSAVHPAAPQSTRSSMGLQDSDGLDMDLAWTLIDAAIQAKPLPAF